MVIENSCDRLLKSSAKLLPWLSLVAGIVNGVLLNSKEAVAQVVPDGTVGTEVNTSEGVTEITGGTRAEGNLFHSFQDFSVATGETAFFNNATDINNIVGRVTGVNISNIDGLIRANGNANLILINPNGINFGANARLDLGGSFLGSTSEQVLFEDGTAFDATSPQPMLTVTAPVGLQLGQSGSIQVETSADTPGGLFVNPGNTLSLVGNGINFSDATIALDSSRIDFGSVATGKVSLNAEAGSWQLDYTAVTEFADLNLAASVIGIANTFNNRSSSINLRGDDVALTRSQVASQTFNDASGADINLNSGSLSLNGTDSVAGSQIVNSVEAEATGAGGQIVIETGQLNIRDRSLIASTTASSGTGGNIAIDAADVNITGTGFAEFQQNFQAGAVRGNLTPEDSGTGIFASTIATGQGGDINIEAESLNLRDGAIIFSPVFTEGRGGNISINAADIRLSGSAVQMGTSGNLESSTSGNINLNTQRLTIEDGGTIINASLSNAATGDIQITASESIAIANTPLEALLLSGIYANTFGTAEGGNITIKTSRLEIIDGLISSNTGGVLSDGMIISTGGAGGNVAITASTVEAGGIPKNPAFTSGIGTSSFSSGDAGNLSIATEQLIIREGADFATATLGSGKGGQLTIDATESVELVGVTTATGTNRGGLLATSGRREFPELVATGASGDIKLNTPSLAVRNGASIDVQSIAAGDAGSLNINADDITLSNRATLSASTQAGTGGDIQITANIFQLDRSLINASVVGAGRGGNVSITTQDSLRINGSGFEFLQNTFFDPNALSPEFLATLDFRLVQEGIFAVTIGTGQAGTVEIDTGKLELNNGGLIATATTDRGAANLIFLNGTESIKVDSSIISASTVGNGQGGDIQVRTRNLEVSGGGQITSSTLAAGDGGSITVDATESIEVRGISPDNTLPSSITVGAQPLRTATGDGGDLEITTADLKISDRGAVFVGSVGTGNAGTLIIDAETISLDRQGVIAANTRSGTGGNIFITAADIIWRGGSFTTADAGANGDGGNITIDGDNLVVLQGSRLIANAFLGTGGNVRVNTQGLFVCAECQIAASSQLGVDGVVDIETLQPNSQLEVLNLPQKPTQPQEAVAVACPANLPANAKSELTIVGRGGLPPNPKQPLSSESIVSLNGETKLAQKTNDTSLLPLPAQSWYTNKDGSVTLSAQALNIAANISANNSPVPTVNCQP